MSKLHPAVAHVLQYFGYKHLPERLQAVSRPFCELAGWLATELPHSPEVPVCLRKLLEAKDAAVRAAVPLPSSSVEIGTLPELPPLGGYRGQLGQ